MAPSLTDQQRQALHETDDAGPVTVIDPTTHAQYVLLRADVFQELQHSTQDVDPRAAYAIVDRLMAEDDARDPTLASYQDEMTSSRCLT
jgi:hypothetical protein